MLQREKRVKMLNLAISFVYAIIMVWLRTGGEIAELVARINIGGILCSTSDFFLIVVTALCGYRYGIIVFIVALAGEIILEKNGVNSLFSLYIYLIVVFLTEAFAQRRWFASRLKSFLAAILYIFALGISWYVTFRVIYGDMNIFRNMGLDRLILSAIPESIVSCLLLYLFFHFAPDSLKLHIGNGYLYLSDYESGKYLSKKSPLRRAVMFFVIMEAVLLSLCAVFFMNLERNVNVGVNGNSYDVYANIRLFLLILIVCFPIAMFFNEIIRRFVVEPIHGMAVIMRNYFSESLDRREDDLGSLESLHINQKNEIGDLFVSLKRMLSDMDDYIRAVKKEKELETELEISQARSEAQSAFFSNVSHEIRTPINAMLGMNEMILRESKDASAISYAKDIQSAGNTLLMLVNDILDFSKIEAGKMELTPDWYELSGLVSDLAVMIRMRAVEKGLTFTVDIDPHLPAMLYGDDLRIKQVITNILTNAVKYTRKGSVTLSMSLEEETEDEVTINVSVKDTGIGIKEEDMDTLFSKFGRLDSAKNRGIEGTGLGMSITIDFLRLMGSELKLESVYGAGSNFYFPIKQGYKESREIGEIYTDDGLTDMDYSLGSKYTFDGEKSDEWKEGIIAGGNGLYAPDAHILVVDDNDMNRKVFKSLLKNSAMRIDDAGSGDEAVRLAKEHRYEMIFLDHMMPEKDGIETLHEIRETDDGLNRSTPAFILTANAVSGAKEMYLAEGFNGFLTKPINIEKLERTIIETLPDSMIKTAGHSSADYTVSENEETMPDDLPMIDGLDWGYAWEHLPGRELLFGALKDFYRMLPSGAEKLSEFYVGLPDDGAFEAYRIQVHGMKGYAATVGIVPLSGMANILEYAARDRDMDSIGKMHDIFMRIWNSYREKLEIIVDDKETDELKSSIEDKSVILGRLELLKNAIHDMDVISADEQMDELDGYSYPAEADEVKNKLKIAVTNLEGENALALIDEFRKMITEEAGI